MANPIDDWIAENYEAIVADGNRGITFDSLAEDAESKGAPDLAAWARGKAAASGKDVTPKSAKPAPKETRSVK